MDPAALSKGVSLLVFWDRFDVWFAATVREVDYAAGRVTLVYEDGYVETIKYAQGVSTDPFDINHIPFTSLSLCLHARCSV
jgi:hypothetical protein